MFTRSPTNEYTMLAFANNKLADCHLYIGTSAALWFEHAAFDVTADEARQIEATFAPLGLCVGSTHRSGASVKTIVHKNGDPTDNAIGNLKIVGHNEELQSALDLLDRLVDCMRRCDSDYCECHDLKPTTDDDWDALMEEAEDFIEDVRAIGPERAI
jgi:hypothetical protein